MLPNHFPGLPEFIRAGLPSCGQRIGTEAQELLKRLYYLFYYYSSIESFPSYSDDLFKNIFLKTENIPSVGSAIKNTLIHRIFEYLNNQLGRNVGFSS